MNDPGKVLKFFYFLILMAAVTFGGSACKSKKKIAAQQAQATQAANIVNAKEELLILLSDEDDRSLVEKERALARIKAMNLDDPEIQAMITRVEEKLRAERENEKVSITSENEAASVSTRLDQYFNAIAQASSTASADGEINEALNLFNSPDALVLIIISRTGSLKDYDKPTTIRKYLEYLKDQKTNANAIDNLVFDTEGKIKEMELIKK
ncbi:MAG: hypothetical protein ACR2MX_12450 [Cyclobacteriaceae bacterium]